MDGPSIRYLAVKFLGMAKAQDQGGLGCSTGSCQRLRGAERTPPRDLKIEGAHIDTYHSTGKPYACGERR